MPEKQYVILLDEVARKRHYHVVTAGKITKFVVQLEVKVKGIWKGAIRFDCAHGYTHKDTYNKKGQTRKMNLHLDYDKALTFADDDINEYWEIYKEKFIKGDFP